MTDTTTTTEDPAAIELDIRRTQDNMSRTVDKIGDQLSIKNVFNALLDKADESNVDARMLLDGARRNPVALGLIAAGTIWLISDKDSKLPEFGGKSSKFKFGKSGDDTYGADYEGDYDIHHRDYVSHMSSIEQGPDEDITGYQRRRDLARSNFFMVERNYDEDDSSFRQRLDGMTDKFREKRRAWADSSSQAQAATRQRAQAAVGKAQDFYTGNPLVGGILAAAVGAAFGSALPVTRQEQDKLGGIGQKARDVIDENKEQVTSQLREKKDQLLDKADAAIQPSGSSTSSSSTSTESQFGSDNMQQSETPFIAGR
jgi:ElaB/YqjD/DUF883 family membrane-anchored ribosome-binding protein